MAPLLRPDPHTYLVVATSRVVAQKVAEFLCIKKWRPILWFNDLNDQDVPPRYRLVVSEDWLHEGKEEHDYVALVEFIHEWERLYPDQVRFVDLIDERKRIDPGPSPLELKKFRREYQVEFDVCEDNTKYP